MPRFTSLINFMVRGPNVNPLLKPIHFASILNLLLLGSIWKVQAQSYGQIIYTIHYTPGRIDLPENDKKELRRLAQICQSDSFSYLKVFGFADSTGTERLNDTLSSHRALQVFNYMNSQAKIDPKLQYVTWLGNSKDVYDLHFPEAHARQRCVDVWILYRRNR